MLNRNKKYKKFPFNNNKNFFSKSKFSLKGYKRKRRFSRLRVRSFALFNLQGFLFPNNQKQEIASFFSFLLFFIVIVLLIIKRKISKSYFSLFIRLLVRQASSKFSKKKLSFLRKN